MSVFSLFFFSESEGDRQLSDAIQHYQYDVCRFKKKKNMTYAAVKGIVEAVLRRAEKLLACDRFLLEKSIKCLSVKFQGAYLSTSPTVKFPATQKMTTVKTPLQF